jgi:hypothetical protein
LRVFQLFIRREALELLKAVPPRDGLWDTDIVLAMITIEHLEIKGRDNRAIDRGEGRTEMPSLKV